MYIFNYKHNRCKSGKIKAEETFNKFKIYCKKNQEPNRGNRLYIKITGFIFDQLANPEDAEKFNTFVSEYLIPINEKNQNEIIHFMFDILIQFYHQAGSEKRNRHKISTLLIAAFYISVKMIDGNCDTIDFFHETLYQSKSSLSQFKKRIYEVELLIISSLKFPIQRNKIWFDV